MQQALEINNKEQKTIELVNSYIRDLEREKGRKLSLSFNRRGDGSYLLYRMEGLYRITQPMIIKTPKN